MVVKMITSNQELETQENVALVARDKVVVDLEALKKDHQFFGQQREMMQNQLEPVAKDAKSLREEIFNAKMELKEANDLAVREES